uniref:NRF domain-containing protein n=1 Tax=Angiostrongylus cantonensis TaxID=6313 RepID=A0A158PCW7_ANGCA
MTITFLLSAKRFYSACLSDIMHYALTAVEYATHVDEHRNCTDCKCTPFFQQKKNERQWIFNVLDAMGKVPSGITAGNNLWVGSWNTCRKIGVVKNSQGQLWKGMYCLAHLEAYERNNPLKALNQAERVDAHCYKETNSSLPEDDDAKCFSLIPMLNFGVCMPDSCTDYDVTRMITFAVRLAESAAGREAVCDVKVECRHESKENSMSSSSLAMAALYFLTYTIIMMVFGTLYDLFIYQKENDNLATARRNTHWFLRMILAYSVYTNGLEILQTSKKEGEVDCLHGIRFLSMCWIILGHTYYYIGTSLTTDNLIPTLVNFPKSFYTQIIVQAPLAVDSFFLLSGLLASYIFFKKLIKDRTIRSATSPLMWLMIYIKRYTRITPTYAVIMLFDVTLFTYVSSGPFWRPIEKQGCRISWWTNFLYMNNFLLQDKECCMGWTWYLANDVQFHYVVAPILFIAFSKNVRWGLLLSGLMMTISSFIKLWIIFRNDYPPAPILTTKLQIVNKLDSYWNDVYVRPYVRCGPFVTGVVIGFFLIYLTRHQKHNVLEIPKKWVMLGWTLSTILGLYSVFGLFNYSRTGYISDWWKALYVVIGRPSYALAIGWITFACATQNGGPIGTFLSWKFFMPLSKITFCAYLLHPIMLQIYNLSRPQPFHFTTLFQMLRHAFEAIVVSYLLAFFFALAFEKPFTAFDEMLMPVKSRATSTKKALELKTQNEEGQPLNS